MTTTENHDKCTNSFVNAITAEHSCGGRGDGGCMLSDIFRYDICSYQVVGEAMEGVCYLIYFRYDICSYQVVGEAVEGGGRGDGGVCYLIYFRYEICSYEVVGEVMEGGGRGGGGCIISDIFPVLYLFLRGGGRGDGRCMISDIFPVVGEAVEGAAEVLKMFPDARDKISLLHELDTMDMEAADINNLLEDIQLKYKTVVGNSGVYEAMDQVKQTIHKLEKPDEDTNFSQIHATLITEAIGKLRRAHTELSSVLSEIESLKEKIDSELRSEANFRDCVERANKKALMIDGPV
ncbi:hypothetical protein CHS0354_036632 [Potamilus streckersoni]|uniref:Uncharacterized protein n=1 Tax=Potamilus streckersoni TaxID=2493646 RepID=A0AAE0SRU1_9BIVA|nr:hypothetical protein CHS0354_036632 [Potamilus streckersoni]